MQPAHSRWKFVEDRRKPVYATLAAELDAIRKGTKPISFFATDREGLDEDLAEIQPAAVKRGLAVTIAPRDEVIDLFVHRVENARLIAAIQTQLSRAPWMFSTEAKLAKLLGYTSAQRNAWLAAERHARFAYGVLTLFGSANENEGIPTLWFVEPGRVPDALAKRPRGERLWRVGMEPRFAKKLDRNGQVSRSSVAKSKAFRDAVRTPMQWLGPKGWQYTS